MIQNTQYADYSSVSAEAVIERMQAALGARTQTELAHHLGVRKAAITDAKRRGHAPSEWLLKLCLERGINPGWLMTGAGPQVVHAEEPAPAAPTVRRLPLVSKPHAAPPDASPHDGRPVLEEPLSAYRPAQSEFELIPMVDARPVMGRGGLEHGDDVQGYYAFRRDWLVRKGRVDSLRLMRVTGVSMEPTLRDEDLVLVDISRTDVLPGKIYVLRIDDELTVKRLDKRPGSLVLFSDNHAAYPPWEIKLSETDNVQIIGRVIWMAREII